MKTILTYGVLLGVLVVGWTLVMGATGWYRSPAMMRLFFLVIPLQIAMLIGMLSRTAAAGRGWGGQVLAGTLASLIAGLIIAGGSLLVLTVLFPGWLDDLRAAHETALRAQGLGAGEIAAAIAADERRLAPLPQALAGLIGTLATGLLTSLVGGWFIRAPREAER